MTRREQGANHSVRPGTQPSPAAHWYSTLLPPPLVLAVVVASGIQAGFGTTGAGGRGCGSWCPDDPQRGVAETTHLATIHPAIVDGIHPSDKAPGLEVRDHRFVDVVAESMGYKQLRLVETAGDYSATERQQ